MSHGTGWYLLNHGSGFEIIDALTYVTSHSINVGANQVEICIGPDCWKTSLYMASEVQSGFELIDALKC